MGERIGIMGGTFDPIHIAHLVIAEEARQAYNLDRVIFIPAYRPPHKQGRKIAGVYDRVKMTELAIADNPAFSLSMVEIERQGPSYSLLTIRELQREYGYEAEFYFITGSDSINELHTWYHAEELVAACHFIGTTRPDSPVDEASLAGRWGELYSHIHLLPVPLMDISSTMLRQRIAQGKSVRYFLSPRVADYIAEMGLYQ